MITRALLLTTLIMTGCEQIADSQESYDYAPALVAIADDAETPEEIQLVSKATLDAGAAVREAIQNSPDWKAADRAIRRLLSQERHEMEQRIWEQYAAEAMLTTHLLPGEASEEKSDAGIFYLDTIVNSGSPNAKLVLYTIEKYESHLTEPHIQHLASTAASSAETFILRQTADCESCRTEDIISQIDPSSSNARDVYLIESNSAINKLRNL